MRKRCLTVIFAVIVGGGVDAVEATCPAAPYAITNGQVADATKVMADINAVTDCVNAAPAGTTGSVQVKGGASSFGAVGPLNDGQTIIGATGAAPQAAYITAGPGIAVTNGPGSIVISAGSSSSAYGSTVYGGSNTSITYDPGVNLSVLDSASVTIPASNTSRAYMVSGSFQFSNQSHGVGSTITLDGTTINSPQNWSGSGDRQNYSALGPILVTVPGDGNSHVIAISVSDSGSTGDVLFFNRWIFAELLPS